MSTPHSEGGPKAPPPTPPSFFSSFISSLPSIVRMREDETPKGTTPRADSSAHIRETVKDVPGPTVGEDVAAAIDGIRLVAGERGSRTVDTVFTDPSLTPYYRRPSTDLEAQRVVAEREVEYWTAQHKTKETSGTVAATGVTVDQRVSLQVGMGEVARTAKSFDKHFKEQYET